MRVYLTRWPMATLEAGEVCTAPDWFRARFLGDDDPDSIMKRDARARWYAEVTPDEARELCRALRQAGDITYAGRFDHATQRAHSDSDWFRMAHQEAKVLWRAADRISIAHTARDDR